MIGQRWSEHYETIRQLGEGREGTVYEAEDLRDGSRVALKVLRRRPDGPRRFEGAALREAEHPHLVRVHEVGLQRDVAFLVQELVPDGTLRDQTLPLSQQALVDLAQQMLSALGSLHSLGMLHGDVKPENIFVTTTDPWNFKLGDFGLSRRSVDVSSGTTRGTPAYMPPEIIRGDPDDERSDFYSLGVTLYECAFGELPFDASSLRELLSQHLHETPVRLSQPGGLPGSLLRLLRALLSKDPAARPRTAVAALSLLAGEPSANLDWVPPHLGVLIGREQERGQLVDLLESPVACVAVQGPEGIGKTRLLREFALEAQLQGVVLWAWDDVGLHGPAGDMELGRHPSEPEAVNSVVAVAQEVEEKLGPDRWILLVDQLELRPTWFRESLEILIRSLGTSPQPGRLLCLAGRVDVQSYLEEALSRAGLPPAPAVVLQPWDSPMVCQATAALLGTTQVDDSVVDLIVSVTGGVPAGVESVVRQLANRKALRTDTRNTVTLGLAVDAESLSGDWLQTALAELDDQSWDVLRVLVVLTNRVTEEVITRLVQRPCTKEIRALQQKGLVRGTARGERILYRTAHDGVQRAALDRMTAEEHAGLHDRIASSLSSDPDALPDEDLDWHRCLGGDHIRGYEAFQRLREKLSGERPQRLLQACDQLMATWPLHADPSSRIEVEMEALRTRLQLGEFEEVVRRSHDTLQRTEDPERMQQIRNLWSDALYALSRTEEALEVLGEPQGVRARWEGMQRRAVVLTQLGNLSDALSLCEQLDDELSEDDPLRTPLVDAKVAILREREELDEAVLVLHQALDEGPSVRSPRDAGKLRIRLGQVEFGRGRMAEARQCFSLAVRFSEEAGDHVSKAWALSGLGATQAEAGEFAAAHDTFLQTLDLCQRLGETVHATNILGNLGQMQSVLGLYGKAFDYSTRGVEWSSRWMMHGPLTRIRIIRAGVLARLGDVEGVATEVDWVLENSDSDRYRGQALAVLVELGIHLPRVDPGEDLLREALGLFERNDIEDEALRLQLLDARRRQRLGLGQESMRQTDRVARRAAQLQLPELVVEAELLRAELLVEGNLQMARQRAEKTVDLARQFGFRDCIWRGEALLAALDSKRDCRVRLQHYQVCVDLFREMTEGLPSRLVSSFLALPRQRRVLDELRDLSSSG